MAGLPGLELAPQIPLPYGVEEVGAAEALAFHQVQQERAEEAELAPCREPQEQVALPALLLPASEADRGNNWRRRRRSWYCIHNNSDLFTMERGPAEIERQQGCHYHAAQYKVA